ncbi:hypothetical protein EAO73_20745 [Streptomyces sp. col6]|nr:hypothetical protein [Streptomyces sp. SID4920]MYX64827.1 hypothetical protein [Streptomyces sp. SID8373]TXS03141.1 hypothetical protein EAO73_20745 [Streptomyces sp. col6]
MTKRFRWRFESSPRHFRAQRGYGPGWPNWQRQTVINLRLSLQAQHAPPIAGSNGPVPVGVEMPVRLRPVELRSAVV